MESGTVMSSCKTLLPSSTKTRKIMNTGKWPKAVSCREKEEKEKKRKKTMHRYRVYVY